MRHATFPKVLLSLALSLLIAGCGDKPAAEADKKTPSILGIYENANDKLTIELKADNKATLTDEGAKTNLVWETDGINKVVIHGKDGVDMLLNVNSEGNLYDSVGGVYRKK
jgi:hypothetical protein